MAPVVASPELRLKLYQESDNYRSARNRMVRASCSACKRRRGDQ